MEPSAESIELFIENQAVSPSYDLDPRPPPSPLSRQQVVSLSQSLCVSPIELTDWRSGDGGRGKKPNRTAARKPGPL